MAGHSRLLWTRGYPHQQRHPLPGAIRLGDGYRPVGSRRVGQPAGHLPDLQELLARHAFAQLRRHRQHDLHRCHAQPVCLHLLQAGHHRIQPVAGCRSLARGRQSDRPGSRHGRHPRHPQRGPRAGSPPGHHPGGVPQRFASFGLHRLDARRTRRSRGDVPDRPPGRRIPRSGRQRLRNSRAGWID